MTRYVHGYETLSPAKDLLVQFWKLESEAEKMMEGPWSRKGMSYGSITAN